MSTTPINTPYPWSSAATGQLYEQAHHDASINQQAVASTILELLPQELAAIEKRCRQQLKEDRVSTLRYLFPEPESRPSPAAALAEFQPQIAKTILDETHVWNAKWGGEIFQFSPIQETTLLDVSPCFLLGRDLKEVYLQPTVEEPLDEHEPALGQEEFSSDQDWATSQLPAPAAQPEQLPPLPEGGLWVALKIPPGLKSLDGLQLHFSGLTTAQAELLPLATCSLGQAAISFLSPLDVWKESSSPSPLDKEGLWIHTIQSKALDQVGNGLVRLRTLGLIDFTYFQSAAYPQAVSNYLESYQEASIIVLPLSLPAGLEASDFTGCTVSTNFVPVWNARRLHLEAATAAPVELRLPNNEKDGMAPFHLLGLHRVYLQSPYRLLQPAALGSCCDYTYQLSQPPSATTRMATLKASIDNFLALLADEVATNNEGRPNPYGQQSSLQESLEASSIALESHVGDDFVPHYIKISAGNEFYYIDYLVTQSSPSIRQSADSWQLPLLLEAANDEVKCPPVQKAFLLTPLIGGKPALSQSEREAYVIRRMTLPQKSES